MYVSWKAENGLQPYDWQSIYPFFSSLGLFQQCCPFALWDRQVFAECETAVNMHFEFIMLEFLWQVLSSFFSAVWGTYTNMRYSKLFLYFS